MAGSIHIKFDYPEALSTKKDLLILQENLINLERNIKAYHYLRKKELSFKSQIRRDIVHINILIDSLCSLLPRDDIKEMKKLEQREEKNIIKASSISIARKETSGEPKYSYNPNTNASIAIKPKDNSDIEAQLREIRDKLARLQES